MSKLYVFGIGGTGSRVIKSLTMLLASGVKLEGISSVVPIIIDPDASNGDVVRTIDILKLYHSIRERISDPSQFFGTSLQTLSQISGDYNFSPDQFKFEVDGTENKKFKEFIGESSLDDANRSLVQLLFSEENLDAEMEVGFKGNPNIGSVVLNQMVQSEQFRTFAQSFTDNDKIFIVSSIFGGTGAAGFPLLIKNLRSGASVIPNGSIIRDSQIGAVTVLPYFNVQENEESAINSDTFLEKAKCAMGYYDRTIIDNKSLNALYYIGDTPIASYKNSEGSDEQKNDAHFIELASALSIVDFCRNSGSYHTVNGASENPTEFKEYGVNIESTQTSMSFSGLDKESLHLLQPTLSSFMMMNLYLNLGLEKSLSKGSVWCTDNATKTDKKFFESVVYQKEIKAFFDYFETWLEELDRNVISFSPFHLNIEEKNALCFIKGQKPNKKFGVFSKENFNGLTKLNNKKYLEFKEESATSQLVKMMEKAIEEEMKDRELIMS